MPPEHRAWPALAHTAQVEQHKEGETGYTWSYTTYTVLPPMNDEQSCTKTHPQLKNGHHWLHQNGVHGQVVHGVYLHPSTIAEQYSKTDRTKPRKYLPRSDLSWNTRQDFLKIKSCWGAALETERRCLSRVILESNVTPNIRRSSVSFSTVPPIVNWVTWDALYMTWRLP